MRDLGWEGRERERERERGGARAGEAVGVNGTHLCYTGYMYVCVWG